MEKVQGILWVQGAATPTLYGLTDILGWLKNSDIKVHHDGNKILVTFSSDTTVELFPDTRVFVA